MSEGRAALQGPLKQRLQQLLNCRSSAGTSQGITIECSNLSLGLGQVERIQDVARGLGVLRGCEHGRDLPDQRRVVDGVAGASDAARTIPQLLDRQDVQ
eukprot:11524636-Heterocapsa_arctica.AAC.1